MTKIVANNYLAEILTDTHKRTMELVAGLDQEQMLGPKLPTVNPLLWEIGHVAWFYEQFILRSLYGYEPTLPNGDALYDSIAIEHEVRWDLPLLPLDECLRYINTIRDRLLGRLTGAQASAQDSFIYQFAAFHQDMHNEAYSYSRQTLAYPAPDFASVRHLPRDATNHGPLPGDVTVPGGKFMLGSGGDASFLFDNEKWAHAVTVDPFQIARAPVSNTEFAAFVADGGYQRPAGFDQCLGRFPVVGFEQFAHISDIGPCAKRAPGSGNDDHAYAPIARELGELRDHLLVQLAIDGVQLVRPVQRYRSDGTIPANQNGVGGGYPPLTAHGSPAFTTAPRSPRCPGRRQCTW